MQPKTIWTYFGVGVAAALAIVGVLSYKLVAYEGRHRQDLADREHQRRVELALWRLESVVGPLLAAENTRPYFHYREKFPSENPHRLYGVGGGVSEGELNLVSPLAVDGQSYVKSYFEMGPEQQVHCLSAEADPNKQVVAIPKNRDVLIACSLPAVSTPTLANWGTVKNTSPKVAREWQIRSSSHQQQARAQKTRTPVGNENIRIVEGVMRPAWDDGRLLNLRQVSINGMIWLQGAELDWPRLKEWLEGHIRDLLPNAALIPATRDHEGDSNRLAGLPVLLQPGASVVVLPSVFEDSFGWLALVVEWCPVLLVLWGSCFVLLLGGGFLLRAMIALDQRRAAFVSAVTHELRTPLTTFRMYVEMQRNGMVTEPKQIAENMEVLDQESARLVHLVENVLAYAQLDQGRSDARMNRCTLEDIAGEVRRQLVPHVERQGAGIRIDCSGANPASEALTDLGAVMQILFNLADNACKYGRSQHSPTILLSIREASEHLEIEVRDFGSGIPSEFVCRLFEPFARAGDAASGDAPGVGLGLALSSRLARSLGGSLIFNAPDTGAAFALRLPLP